MQRLIAIIVVLASASARASDAPVLTHCVVVADTAGCASGCSPWTPPSCPSGFVEVAKPTICGGGSRAISTPVGEMVAGKEPAVTTERGYAGCSAGSTVTVYGTVSVDGLVMHRQQCSQRREWSQRVPIPANECIQHTQVSTSRTDGVSAAYGLLCCPTAQAPAPTPALGE